MMGHSKNVSVNQAMTKWSDYMNSLGLGCQLGVDLPNERRGLIPVADYYEKAYKGAWNGMTILGNAIGQGEVKVTPLQLANLSAIIANGGSYFIPHVVKCVQSGDIDAKFRSKKFTKVTKEACDVVAQGMRMSAMGGVCKVLSRMPIEACGMSGAASSSGNENSIFIGYAPLDNPKIAVAVIVEGGGWGGKFAVPVGGLIMEQYLNGGLSDESKSRSKALQEEYIECNMD
jgi:penicillin-binding protein 2